MKVRSYYIPNRCAILLVAATILLMWFGYRATSEWQRSTAQVVDRRTVEVLYLMVTAFSRDMRAVQSQVLFQLAPPTTDAEVYELCDEIAKAFASFPYPDSFFSWTARRRRQRPALRLFNRADRPPTGARPTAPQTPFPTTLLRIPLSSRAMMQLLRSQAPLRTRFILFETTIGGEPYQVIARPVYLPASRTTLRGIVGFTVNLNWVRAHYFTRADRSCRASSKAAAAWCSRSSTRTARSLLRTGRLGVQSITGVHARTKIPLDVFRSGTARNRARRSVAGRYWTARAQRRRMNPDPGRRQRRAGAPSC